MRRRRREEEEEEGSSGGRRGMDDPPCRPVYNPRQPICSDAISMCTYHVDKLCPMLYESSPLEALPTCPPADASVCASPDSMATVVR